MDKGKRNLLFIVIIMAVLDIAYIIGEFIFTKNIGVFNSFEFLICCFVYQSLYLGKKWARYYVLFFSCLHVLSVIRLLQHFLMAAKPLDLSFWVLCFIGLTYLGIALVLSFNKAIKHYNNHQTKISE